MTSRILAFLTLLVAAPAMAGTRSSQSYTLSAESLDAAGAAAQSTSYRAAASLGGISGASTAASPAQTMRHGYAAQLFDPATVILTAPVLQVVEAGGTLQLAGSYLAEDALVASPVPANEFIWSLVSGTGTFVSPAGLVTTAPVPSDMAATVTASYLGITARISFQVLDTISDNYASYAGDGLPDDWQERYFGLENPLAAPGIDADGDGQSNAFEHAAGVRPNALSSRFYLLVEPGSGAGQVRIRFGPRFEDRSYQVLGSSTLSIWSPLGDVTITDLGEERVVLDHAAGSTGKFYTISITPL